MEKNTNYDVWAIQNYPEEVYNALKNIKESHFNVLFRGCTSSLLLGSKEIKVYFDTAFYSEDSDMVLFLMRDGKLNGQDLKQILKKQEIGFSDIVFDIYDDPKRDEFIPEIWFAREKYVLEDALLESKKKGITTCTYYPQMDGNFEFYYLNSETEKRRLDGRNIKGVIELEDKMILLINQQEERNLSMEDTLRILMDNDIKTVVEMKDELPDKERAKQYRRKQ